MQLWMEVPSPSHILDRSDPRRAVTIFGSIYNLGQNKWKTLTPRHLELACVKLHNTQEEFREKTRDLEGKIDSLSRLHDGRISTLEKQLKEFKKVNDFLVNKVAAQAKQISVLYLKPPQLSWRINDVEKVLSQAREKNSTVLESPPFYSANNGYKLKLHVYPNGDRTSKNNWLSVFLVIVEGEYDALLPWPFHQRITFILVDQQKGSDEKKNIVMKLTTIPLSRVVQSLQEETWSSLVLGFPDL